ncbi:MAG TPA: type II toxin-antitoxin system VapC family toxin [Acidimicrobiales bacterium]|nr:type II toxin-antitoxin system VapC family toxin [Acidimicrobiales bacterium]
MHFSDDQIDVLVDTSVAIPHVVGDHEHHQEVRNLLRGRVAGLAGHAAFESFSVLTRLPPPLRLTPSSARMVLMDNFPGSRFLSSSASNLLFEQLAELRIAGGSIYDALIGACALEFGLPLITRDLRALPTYRSLNVEIEFID